MKLDIFYIRCTFLALLLMLGYIVPAFSQSGSELCVVLDAGHGGKDPGAVGGGVLEKDVTLATALLVGQILEERMPKIKVVYTRTTDRFVELTERTNIANKSNADLFVSIHTNASESKEAHGVETFVMGVDKAGSNLGVAMRENGVISMESDYSSKYEGYDPSSSESLIIFSLMQYSFSRQSLELAAQIQRNYGTAIAPVRDRGVKQAGFLVLWRAAMPSVLTEIGFISNPAQRQYISSSQGQRKIAGAIADAVISYLKSMEGAGVKASPVSKPASKSASVVKPKSEVTASGQDAVNKRVTSSDDQNLLTGEVQYRVQVASSRRKIDVNSSNFGRYVSQVVCVKVGDLYKYYVGCRDSYKEILLLQSQVRRDFADAFCVAFQGDEFMSLDKARKIKP